MKIYWEVSPAPTGRYKSFQRRTWPSGYTDKEKTNIACFLTCADEYNPRKVKTGDHGEISISIAVYNEKNIGFQWKRLNKTAKTLTQAKEIVEKFLNENGHLLKNKEE